MNNISKKIIIFIVGLILLFHGLFQIYQRKVTITMSSKYLYPVIDIGGVEIILGLGFLVVFFIQIFSNKKKD